MGFLLIRVEGPFLVAVPYARKIEWESEYFNFPLKNLVNPLLFIGGFVYGVLLLQQMLLKMS